jgi:hypothetical protein
MMLHGPDAQEGLRAKRFEGVAFSNQSSQMRRLILPWFALRTYRFSSQGTKILRASLISEAEQQVSESGDKI